MAQMGRNIFQQFYHKDLQRAYRGFTASGGDIILGNLIGDIPDLQDYFESLRKQISSNTKVLISYHNPAWEPVLTLASRLGLRRKVGIQNWLDQSDLANILQLSGFEVISSEKRFFGITTITIARMKNYDLRFKKWNYSVSIVIPARNEEGNIPKIIPSIPKFGKWQEIIFVEGHSQDKTWERIKIEELRFKNNAAIHKSSIINHKSLFVRAFKQTDKGKADAVKLGLENATGDILMIYDADRTMAARDLEKFFNALALHPNVYRFANGSRMVYPMEHDAMRGLNKIGNKMFGYLFTWILGTRFKDTLCGTKAMWRRDYIKYRSDYKKYLETDPFGDFALIFTTIKHNLKVVEIPVRYKERVYGATNINRFYHGLLLAKMALQAFIEFKL
jgi:glycosyltransferase involved in cell wall biosynthesis